MFNGVADEFVFSIEVQLAHDVAHMVLHGFGRNKQLLADVLIRVPTWYELQYFAFPIG